MPSKPLVKHKIIGVLFTFQNETKVVSDAIHKGFGLKVAGDVADTVADFAGSVKMFYFPFSDYDKLLFKWGWPLIVYVCRRKCKGCEMCYKSEFLKCLKTKECGPWIPALLNVKEGASRARKLHPRCKDPSLKKYHVHLKFSLFLNIFRHELCTACERVGHAKRYYGGQTKSHKCQFGGTANRSILLS